MCDLHARDDAQAEQPLRLTDFIDELVVALASVRIYGEKHPRVQLVLQQLELDLDEFLTASGKESFDLGTVDGYLVHDRRPLLGATLAASRLIEPLTRIDSGGLSFTRGAKAPEFLVLAQLLGRRVRLPGDRAEAERELQAGGCANIHLLPAYRTGDGDGEGTTSFSALFGDWAGDAAAQRALALDVPVKLYQRVVDNLQDVMVRVCRREAVGLEHSRSLVESILKRLAQEPGAMLDLARYERYDAFTFGHSIRVCLLALNFARVQTQESPILQRIGLAAMMHDVGKAWVPFEILHSTARLSDEERAEMSRHTTYGGSILTAMDAEPSATAAAFGHHRSGLRGGYPQTLHEAELSSTTRIVKICDVYEALTAVRPYKEAMSPTRAYRIMYSMRDHFDAALQCRFIEVNGIYPDGSHLRLSTGESARVVGQSRLIDRPRVLLTSLPDGEPVESDPDNPVDLSTDLERDTRAVVELLHSPTSNILAA